MTSHRPYRKAPGREVAIAELGRNAGTQLHPEVVDALCRVLDRGGVGEAAGGHDRLTAGLRARRPRVARAALRTEESQPDPSADNPPVAGGNQILS